jgi:hypothetical protein
MAKFTDAPKFLYDRLNIVVDSGKYSRKELLKVLKSLQFIKIDSKGKISIDRPRNK